MTNRIERSLKDKEAFYDRKTEFKCDRQRCKAAGLKDCQNCDYSKINLLQSCMQRGWQTTKYDFACMQH